jgi:hypothetical protein
MKNLIPEAQDLQRLVEAALEEQRTKHPVEVSALGSTAVGDVLDTHHPTLPGRVLVRWLDEASNPREEWLEPERHLSLVKGDRVLITRPTGWPEWVVTGALGFRAAAGPSHGERGAGPSLTLAPGETLSVLGHGGQPLVVLHQGAQGPRLEITGENLEISAKNTLRLSAGTLELVSGDGGTDLRTEGDVVVRGRFIRLN